MLVPPFLRLAVFCLMGLLLVTVFCVLTLSFPSLEPPRPSMWNPREITLTIQAGGRLGNRMFEFASLIGIGRSNGVSVVIPTRLNLLDSIFDMTQCQIPTMNSSSRKDFYRLITPHGTKVYDARFENIRQHFFHSKMIIMGYMQSYRYFQEHEDFIRSCFQFKKVYKERVDHFFKTQIPENRTVIGIHVRRGDKLDRWHELFSNRSILSVSYFHKAMNLMQMKYPNAFFVVASNDMEWAKANLADRAIMSPFNSSSFVYDFALLANCQHSIISIGTFGWWTAWLANGTTIYFNNYPREGEIEGFIPSDYYYKDWIPLGD
ncbi:hypothetical protein CAPTEDRAFT_205606 [Capitella teleta]|uniref:L-Fucosyltransferase n=1 Tax=Capitella teleta TaxID=283909 RepID=R7TX42_CAPTE|nr:hypothetical protein CAPTEDRAFT_205606 [Capitella teleta]|eukprot:ELT98488.1 hypothetical protein CAPTEDRAFT_205606 [Capitella teleta]